MEQSMTFLELFASLYLSPQEIASESGVPLDIVLNMRDGKPVKERYIRQVLRVVNLRRQEPITLQDIPAYQIIWD
jgi:hypothetical protein